MPKEEQNGPGFYYWVKWRLAGMDNKSAGEFHKHIFNADTTSLLVRDQPIYRKYDIYVLSVNVMGEAAEPPRLYVGHSSEDG